MKTTKARSRRTLCQIGGLLAAAALAPVQVDAADVSILDKPGAIHHEAPPPTAPERRPGFSLIPPAHALAEGATVRSAAVPAVRLTGVIEEGDAKKVERLLERLARSPAAKPDTPLTTIELSSMGGSLYDGIAIGRLLKKHRVIAVVRQRDFCLSSCALAFLGGNESEVPAAYPTRCNVELGGKVAFHNFFLNPQLLGPTTTGDAVASRLQGFADARGGAAALVRYAADVGMPPAFAASLMGRPVDDFQYIETVAQFLDYNVCPIGLGRPSLSLEQQAINVCRNATDAESSARLEARSLPAQGVRRYLLERVQENMRSSRSRGKLAGLLASGAVMRVPEEIEKLYEDLRAAGMALPEILGPVFEIVASDSGSPHAACYVSLSSDAPENFDVVVSSDRGLAFPRHNPPENARKLFLFDRGTRINPRPK